MNSLRIILIIVLSLSFLHGRSQVTFIADTLEGCDSLTVVFRYINTDFVDTINTVEWDFGNGETGTGKLPQVITYDSAGTYTPSMLLDASILISRSGYIKVHRTPDARFTWTDSLEMGFFTVVMRSIAQPTDTVRYSYDWQLEDGGSGNTPLLIHRFPSIGDFLASLRVTHPAGCYDQHQRLITVRDSLVCPNVFSPNDDGINDFFVVGSNGLTPYVFEVYSRTGILVYKAEAANLIWDGRNISGQELLPGTYYYVIKPADGSTAFEKRGFIVLYH